MAGSLSDTNPAVEKILIEHWRKKSISERFQLVSELSTIVRSLSKRAISRANPGLTKIEIDLLFVKYNYGEEEFKKIKNYLLKQTDAK